MKSADRLLRKDIVGWSLYDFANTIYSMNITSMYLKRYIVDDLGKDDRYFDIPFSLSMLLAALLLPALGAMSDHSAKKKIFLFLFTLTCCIAVGGMTFVPPGFIFVTIILFIAANFSYEAGMPFYNSLLYSVASGRRARLVSGIGVGVGYVGAILGIILVQPFVSGSVLGLDVPFIEGGGKVASFLPTALLFALFALPIFLWVKEAPVKSTAPKVSWKKAYKDVWDGLRQTKKYPGVLRFLVADYFFEDAVATVIVNISLYLSVVVGLAEDQISTFLIITPIAAVIGSFFIGKLAQIWSLKRLVNIIVYGWVIALILFVFVENMMFIWILGSIVGVLMGGLWTTTRPLLAELVPREELGRFFGLFSLSGRAAAFMAPLIWTTVVYFFQPDRILGQTTISIFGINDMDAAKLPYRVGVLSLSLMMIVGLYIFRRVPSGADRVNG
ncbi:MAG: MFS transporter [candidate division Zixibacteria bacterium]|nr:MFS transporter [candidate division Zixibacteria bacterium]MDH3939007.1 MFS transporter [candidate division Zixibacteria bacterium]MDH4033260.1 MFS transporter [candidate division Zixibacteria bacterium]